MDKDSSGVRSCNGHTCILELLIEIFYSFGQANGCLQVTTCIYNLILGKLYCDHFGTMKIQGNGDLVCKLKFKEQTIMDRNPHQVLLFGA